VAEQTAQFAAAKTGGTNDILPALKDLTVSKKLKPTIACARAVAEAMNARQVVVVAFDDAGQYAVVSYGVTKAECRDVARLCDAIAEGIVDGLLPAPEAQYVR